MRKFFYERDNLAVALGRRINQHIERFARAAVDEHFHVSIVIFELDNVALREDRVKLLLQKFRVFGADAKHRHRADVAEHGIADALLKLRDILMGDIERKPVLSRFGKYG